MNPYVAVPVEFCQLDTNLEIHKVHSTPNTTKISVVGSHSQLRTLRTTDLDMTD